MADLRAPGSKHMGDLRPPVLVGLALVSLALVAALCVVVMNSRRVRPEALPPSLQTAPPDTGLVVFRASVRRKTLNLSARCESKRKQLGTRITPVQVSLGRECDSAVALVLRRLADLDAVNKSDRTIWSDSVKAAYDRAKLAARVFTRAGLTSDLIDEDSLDQEIRKLISE